MVHLTLILIKYSKQTQAIAAFATDPLAGYTALYRVSILTAL